MDGVVRPDAVPGVIMPQLLELSNFVDIICKLLLNLILVIFVREPKEAPMARSRNPHRTQAGSRPRSVRRIADAALSRGRGIRPSDWSGAEPWTFNQRVFRAAKATWAELTIIEKNRLLKVVGLDSPELNATLAALSKTRIDRAPTIARLIIVMHRQVMASPGD